MELIPASSKQFQYVTVVVVLLAASGLWILLRRLTAIEKDTREPLFINPKIPYIGHVLNMLREGADYFGRLAKLHHQSIYTLPILKGRMYVACSAEWGQAVQKTHKTLVFNTLVAQAMQKIFCLDESTMALVNENLNGENGRHEGLMWVTHDMQFETLAPGPLLDDMNRSILRLVASDVNGLARQGPARIKLWQWLRHHFSIASVTAVWGPNNPFALFEDIEPAFWEFEANMMSLMMMPMPHLLARKAFKLRQRLFDTFEQWVEKGGYKDPGTSQMIKNRANIHMDRYHISKKMFAQGEVSLLLGVLINTIPASFWLISWIFEDPQLLADIRKEVADCISQCPSRPDKRLINATKLRTSCPLFSSTFRETLRLAAPVNVNRWVLEDTTVTNSKTGETRLLKKDSVVQIATNVIHQQSVFGADAESFNARRFLATGEKARSEAEAGKPSDPAAQFRDAGGKVHNYSFRAFGGGNNLCPGRHFAQTEIMALTALFVDGFEMANVGGDGWYKMPPFEEFRLLLSTTKPGRDVEVDIRRRKGFEDVEWVFEM